MNAFGFFVLSIASSFSWRVPSIRTASAEIKKEASIQIALAEAMRNCASSFFGLKPFFQESPLRLKTEAIDKSGVESNSRNFQDEAN
jgi:hypothetical protein